MNAGERCGISLNPSVDTNESVGPAGDESVGSVSGESIGTAVVSAVADAKGVDPLELEPLYDVVDADAIDAIFSETDGSSSLELRFTMAGCEVVVGGAGDVSVTPPTRQSAAGAALSRGD